MGICVQASMLPWKDLNSTKQQQLSSLYRCLRQHLQSSFYSLKNVDETIVLLEQLKKSQMSSSEISHVHLQCLQIKKEKQQTSSTKKLNYLKRNYWANNAGVVFVRAMLRPKYHCRGLELQTSLAFVLGGSGQLAAYHCLRDDGKKIKILMPSVSVATGYGVMAVVGKQEIEFSKESAWKGKLPASYSIGLGPVIKFGPHFSFYGMGAGAGAIVIDPINRLQVPMTMISSGDDFQQLHQKLIFYP
jgi:hypothetical protein